MRTVAEDFKDYPQADVGRWSDKRGQLFFVTLFTCSKKLLKSTVFSLDKCGNNVVATTSVGLGSADVRASTKSLDCNLATADGKRLEWANRRAAVKLATRDRISEAAFESLTSIVV